MASSLADNHGNTSLSLDRQILQVARHQLIHSHFARCTQVPWHSLTSMVSCLALVNDIHQWSVIQWLLFMLDIDTFIRMTRIVPSGFAAGEDYTLFMTLSAITAAWLQIHDTTTVPLSLFHDSFSSSSASSTSHFLIQQTSVTATAVVNFHMILQQWHLPWYNSRSGHTKISQMHSSWSSQVSEGMLFSNL